MGFLTERIADLDNLYLAFVKACRGKQRKQEVLVFKRQFDRNMANLRQQILTGNVSVGNYHHFTIHDPKERIICAAPFAERVLHHAIMNVCHEYFDRSLIPDTYATRPGKGVYAALDRAVFAATRYRFLVKLDFRKYYDSIGHDVLKQKLERKFKDKLLLRIFSRIIDSYHPDTGIGLPIGNLTSQYFANAYLSDLDHRAKEQLRVPMYIRYMDDILMAADSKSILTESVCSLDTFAQKELLLKLKPPIYSPSEKGVIFLGYKVLPHHYMLSGRSKRRFRTKLMKYEKRFLSEEWTEREYAEHLLPLISFVVHADSLHFRKSCMTILDNIKVATE